MTETPSYEQARDELAQVVQRLEAGGSTLQESIELWERGEELAGLCQRLLAGARARFDSAVSRGEPATEPPTTGEQTAEPLATGEQTAKPPATGKQPEPPTTGEQTAEPPSTGGSEG
jgi:exodeoxyribonuclease VII small subunit